MATSSTTKTMHYGGTRAATSPTGLSTKCSKLAGATTLKAQKRLEMIVRMENAGLSERQIAPMLTISVPRLRYLRKGAAYLAVRLRITHGIILDDSATLSQVKEQRREMLKEMLPDALQVIADVLKRPSQDIDSMKVKAKVALEVMDREGTFAKITRTEVKPVESFDFDTHDKEAEAIASVINGLGAGAPVGLPTAKGKLIGSVAENSEASEATELDQIMDAVRINEQFSNSHTVSHVDQQAALDELEASAVEAAQALLDAPTETDEIQ